MSTYHGGASTRSIRVSRAEMATPRWVWLAWIALVVATIIAYGPAIRAPFIFDDVVRGGLTTNPTIRQLWPPWVALHPPGNGAPTSGRPISNYSFAISYAINARLGVDQRPDPDGPDKTIAYHAGDLFLHLTCGLLLFGILARTIAAQRFDEAWRLHADAIALSVVALWLLHPIQTEAVDYISQRTELLVSAFYLGTLYASIRAWTARGGRARMGWYVVSVVSCLLGMGSKEVMVSAPLAVILYDRAFRTERWRDLVTGARAPLYAALMATTGWLIALVAGAPRGRSAGFHTAIPWYAYLYTQAWAILHYLRLVIWPTHLNIDYGTAPVHGAAGIPGVCVLAVFALATLAAWRKVEQWGWFAFIGAWFFMLLAPSSSFVPISTEIAAERRMYLALVCVILLAVAGVDAAQRRLMEAWG